MALSDRRGGVARAGYSESVNECLEFSLSGADHTTEVEKALSLSG